MKTLTYSASILSKAFLQYTFIAALFLACLPSARADTKSMADQFPDADRVTSDYPDPVQSTVALNLLNDTLRSKSTAPDALIKCNSYYKAYMAIRQKQQTAGMQAATDYEAHVGQLTYDRKFHDSVLAKYKLANIANGANGSAQPRRNTDVSDAMIQGAFFKGVPFMLLGLLAMYFVIKLMVRNTTNSPTLNLPPPADGLPPLPQDLSDVKVPGTQYTIMALSAMVIDKETSTQTTFHTTTAPANYYRVGDQFYAQGGQTTTTATTTQTDLIWILTPDKRETSWTFTGGSFKTRPGHFISAIARCLPDNSMQFLLAYNHTTRQLEPLAIGGAHGTRRGRWAWPLSAMIGAIGFAIAITFALNLQPPDNPSPLDLILSPIASYLEALVITTIVGIVMVFFIKSGVAGRRNRRFRRKYLPGLQQFLEQRTPLLEKQFNAPQIK